MLEILHQPDLSGYRDVLEALGPECSEPVIMEAKGADGVKGYLIYSLAYGSKAYMPPEKLQLFGGFWGEDMELLDGMVRAVYLKGALKGVSLGECRGSVELQRALETLGLTDSKGLGEIEKILSGDCGSKKCKKSC